MQQINSSSAVSGAATTAPNSIVAPATPRIPAPVGALQYNHCKNPACSQFGLEPEETATRGVLGAYSIVGGGKNYPLLKCNCCGETPPLKSNQGISEEIERLGNYLKPTQYFCPNTYCENHFVPVGTPKAYRSFGTNAHGSKRMQCCKCKKTFATSGKPNKGQHDSHLNKSIFTLLVNKMPLARIVKMSGISWNTLYRRIDFIHSQCVKFAANRERKLRTKELKRLYLSIDRQDYLVNWTQRKDKRNVVLTGITAVDNCTNYVFASAVNFDETIDRDIVESDAKYISDGDIPAPHRKYARLWTEQDYINSAKSGAKSKQPVAGELDKSIELTYANTQLREDVEEFDGKDLEERLPDYGMQIHSEYTMIGLFYHLKQLVGNCEKWRFFVDQESGIRAAILAAFKEEVKNNTCEAFYVRIQKGIVMEDKRKLMNAAKDRFEQIAAQHLGLPEEEVKLMMLKDEIKNAKQHGVYKDRWINAPLPTLSEPAKAVCWITEHDKFDEDHVAWLYNKASLHGVDTYFMKARRGLAMCERPISSSANNGRIWSAYQAYNPAILKKVLEIFRVYHNYVDLPSTGKKAEKTTPAQRIGLADAALPVEDILYYRET